MEDNYSLYEIAVCELIRRLSNKDDCKRYHEVLGYQHRLNHYIIKCRTHGEPKEFETQFNEIISQLNRVSLLELNVSFNDICNNVSREKQDDVVKQIPFIIVAMTQSEAAKLFENYNESEKLKLLIDSISKGRKTTHFIRQLIERYAETRNKWKPFEKDSRTISDIINDLLPKLIKILFPIREEEANIDLIPDYYESAFFSSNLEERSEIRDYFIQRDCIFIVDTISLFNPEIRDRFLQSQLAATKPIIGILPISKDSMAACEIIEESIKDKFEWVYERYQRKLEYNCSLEAYSLPSFNRWLYKILPDIVKRIPQAAPENINKMKENLKYNSKGFQKVVLSMGGAK
ncbi:MAG: hypothetical protein GTO45_03195 [Candidatus Aminicenantes bacterium]|nr:hypothetical protein [Candidatus Aminicenantes bacterium]NIM77732.1 hypothetical protein [Candidatus Aminicenantes bacterium]NIN17045.1 hypothetical protein [Candidatus Aminicenantes bacterium]NIN40938.1 hypothetical protein [Candidatus Aminicenantes bacterium]NIN83743.1 hypothetical protein [Candidatus Aminicenantes bacterium]